VRSAIRAVTRVTVDGPRVRWTHEWPVVVRPTGSGPAGERVHLVHAAGGPLGGDDLALSVDVGPGARLAVHSAGATLVQPGAATDAPARWTVDLRVGAGGRLHWAPEPTVVSDRAALESAIRVTLAPGAAATVRETVVLGRHGQRGGRYAGATHVVVDEVPLLAHTTVLDGADAALCGPAGTAGARAVGTLVRAGALPLPAAAAGESDGVRWAWTLLDGPGAVLLAVGTPAAVTAVLDAAAVVPAAVAPPGAPALLGRAVGVA
jgi:urease accessory protein